MHAGANINVIAWFVHLYGKIIHELKLVDYLPLHLHKLYNNFYMYILLIYNKLQYTVKLLNLFVVVQKNTTWMVVLTFETLLTPGRWQSKTPILSRIIDQKSIETVFSIAICHHTGDKWQSKTLFLSIFDARSLIVDNVFDCRLPGVLLITFLC